MLKKVVFLICAVNIVHLSNGQDNVPFVPPVVSPSPNAASLGQYGDHPVSTYTGIPNISIPIFTIEENGNTLPISLSYHAAGVKPRDWGSSVGIGWSMQSGGAITRSISGLDDFATNVGNGGIGYLSTDSRQHVPMGNFTSSCLYDHLDPINTSPVNGSDALLKMQEQLRYGIYDSQPDHFFFNFNGYSGEFVYNRQRQIRLVKKSTDENISIRERKAHNSGEVESFEITLGNGDVYFFAKQERTRSNRSGGHPQAINYTYSITSWYLTKVEFYTGGDIIFNYSEASSATNLQEVNFTRSSGVSLCPGLQVPHRTTSSTSIMEQVFLTSISFTKGSLHLYYSGRRLDKIEVLDHTDIEVFNFKFAYEILNTDRRWLTTVTEYGGNGSRKPPYTFEYYKKELLPSRSTSKTQVDHWGYYNGGGGFPKNYVDYPYNYKDPVVSPLLAYQPTHKSSALVAYHQLGFRQSGNREPNAEMMKYGILTKINYPTGGYSTFDFEANEYSNFQPYFESDTAQTTTSFWGNVCAYTNHNGGSNSCAPGQSTVLTNWFSAQQIEIDLDIGPFDSDYDHIYLKVERSNGSSDFETLATLTRRHNGINIIPTESGLFRITAVATNSGPVSGYINASISGRYAPISNTLISRKIGPGLRIKKITTHDGVSTANDVVRTYEYDHPDTLSKSSGVLMSKPEYTYEDYTYLSGGVGHADNYCTVIMVSQSSIVPLSASASGSYIGYSNVTELFSESGELGKVTSTFVNLEDERRVSIKGFGHPLESPSQVIPGFPRENYSYINGSLLSANTYEYITLDDRFLIKQRKAYTYDTFSEIVAHAHIVTGTTGSTTTGCPRVKWGQYEVKSYTKRLQNEQTTNYEGNDSLTIRSNYYYTTTNGTKLDHTTTLRPGVDYETSWMKYKDDFSTRVISTANDYARGSSAYKRNSGYYIEYTFGKPRRIYAYERPGVTDISLMPTTTPQSDYFVLAAEYQYNDHDRLAQEVRRDQVPKSYVWGYNNAYPIAEVVGAMAEDIFHTSFEEDGVVDNAAKTGGKVKTGGYTFPTTFAPTATDLVMTYWYWQSGVWQFSGEVPFDTTISANKIDEVRVYPAGALMTTLTYKPLVGVTSITDPSNTSQYYEYDAFNRLLIVRDHEQNILRQNTYNYAN